MYFHQEGMLHSGSASVSHTEGRGFDSPHLQSSDGTFWIFHAAKSFCNDLCTLSNKSEYD